MHQVPWTLPLPNVSYSQVPNSHAWLCKWWANPHKLPPWGQPCQPIWYQQYAAENLLWRCERPEQDTDGGPWKTILDTHSGMQFISNIFLDSLLTLIQSAFSLKLFKHGFNYFDVMVPDLMHEFELGVWKSIFIHLLRILTAHNPEAVDELNARCALPLKLSGIICKCVIAIVLCPPLDVILFGSSQRRCLHWWNLLHVTMRISFRWAGLRSQPEIH